MSDNVSRVQRNSKVPVVNLPNALTVLRLVLVPIFVVLGLQSQSWSALWAAFFVFAVAAITDRFDGELARSWGQITDFLIAVRELGITAMRAFFLRRGVVVSANQAGKLKTFMQMIALGMLLIPWAHFTALNEVNEGWVVILIRLGQIFAGVALALTLYSGVMYVIEGVRLMRGSSAGEAEVQAPEVPATQEAASESPKRGLAGQHVQS